MAGHLRRWALPIVLLFVKCAIIYCFACVVGCWHFHGINPLSLWCIWVRDTDHRDFTFCPCNCERLLLQCNELRNKPLLKKHLKNMISLWGGSLTLPYMCDREWIKCNMGVLCTAHCCSRVWRSVPRAVRSHHRPIQGTKRIWGVHRTLRTTQRATEKRVLRRAHPDECTAECAKIAERVPCWFVLGNTGIQNNRWAGRQRHGAGKYFSSSCGILAANPIGPVDLVFPRYSIFWMTWWHNQWYCVQ